MEDQAKIQIQDCSKSSKIKYKTGLYWRVYGMSNVPTFSKAQITFKMAPRSQIKFCGWANKVDNGFWNFFAIFWNRHKILNTKIHFTSPTTKFNLRTQIIRTVAQQDLNPYILIDKYHNFLISKYVMSFLKGLYH